MRFCSYRRITEWAKPLRHCLTVPKIKTVCTFLFGISALSLHRKYFQSDIPKSLRIARIGRHFLTFCEFTAKKNAQPSFLTMWASEMIRRYFYTALKNFSEGKRRLRCCCSFNRQTLGATGNPHRNNNHRVLFRLRKFPKHYL